MRTTSAVALPGLPLSVDPAPARRASLPRKKAELAGASCPRRERAPGRGSIVYLSLSPVGTMQPDRQTDCLPAVGPRT